jgi:tetratricopeptide (TPR) repeat protein
MRTAVLACCLVARLLTLPSVLAAQDAPLSADDLEARNLFAAGQTAFEAGRFERALEYFERAYELSHRPGLLYNVGVAADRLRNDQRALEAFEAYLASGAVEEAQRPAVEARVEALRRALASEAVDHSVDGATTPSPSETQPPDATPPDATVSIALLVAGGVVLVSGAVLLGVAASEDAIVQGATDGSSWNLVAGHHDAANALAISGGVTLGVGAVLAVVGALIWPSSTPSSPTSSTSARLDARGLSIQWGL